MNIYGRMIRISRPKISGVGRHEGVLLPTGHVAHTTQEKGAHVCTFDQFKAKLPIKIEHELHPLMHQQALQRLQKLLTKQAPYDPILNNCEIFARTILLEEPQSPQVGFWAIAALLAALWLSAAG
ncbi:NC domain protein [Polaromonas sp. SP1]|nr:NC domain protein [Polaromonas sp. SP1]